MGWTLEFVDYTEIKTGVASETFTDDEILDFDYEPNSVIGVDYYKQEPKFLKLSLFATDWLDNQIGIFLNGENRILDTNFFSFVARIKYNGNFEYVGYLSADKISYDKEFGVYSLMFVDTYSFLKFNAKNINGIGSLNSNLQTALLDAINRSLKQSSTPTPDISVIENYDFVSGIYVEDIEIYDKDNDTELETLLTSINTISPHSTLEIGNFDWERETFDYDVFYNTFFNVTSANVLYPKRNILSIYNNEDGLFVSFMLEYIRYSSYNEYLSKRIIHKVIKITQDIEIEQVVLNTDEVHYVGSVVTGASETFIYNFWHDDTFYNEYISNAYPTENNLKLSVGEDNYGLINNGNIVNYTGTMNLYNVTWISTSINYLSAIRLMLLLNNLCLNIKKNGDVEITNKTKYNSTSIEINSNHVISHNYSGILKSELDYSSIVSIISGDLQAIIIDAMNDYYNTLFGTLSDLHNIEIENYYNLSINDTIDIDSIQYKISSIKLDVERFIYTIKAWRI